MNFYSQFGQDKFLYENYFKSKPEGTFVDIGAHDGISGSNSYFFELLGWNGICFEPIPSVFEKLKQNRKCDLRNLALSNKKETQQFFVIEGHSEMLSGLVSQYEQAHIARILKEIEEHNQKYNYIDVECSTFNDEVDLKNIDILSIDVEGSEFSILKTIDFSKYNISFIVFEMNYMNQNLLNFMNSKNFSFIHQAGIDLIYKNNNI